MTRDRPSRVRWLPALLGAGLLVAPAGAAPTVDLSEPTDTPAPAPAATPRDPTPHPAESPLQHHDLTNGLSVVLQTHRAVPSVAIQLWVKMGLADEGPGERGAVSIAEQLLRLRIEDLLVSGSPQLRAALPSLQVHSDRDATVLSLEAPSRAFEGMLRALALVVRSPRISPERFESARALALENLRHRLRDGDAVALSALHSLAFRVHPYRNQALGSLQALSARTPAHIERFLARKLRPDSSWLVVVGAVSEVEAARAVIRELGPWTGGDEPSEPKIIEPKMMSERLGTLPGPDNLHRVAIGFPAPPYRGEDAPAIALLARALDPRSGTNLSRVLLRSLPPGSRLEAEFTPARDPSLLTVMVAAPTLERDAFLESLRRALASLHNSGLSEGDLDLAKQSITNLALARSQGHAHQARALGLTAILSSPEPPYPVLEKVLALGNPDLQQAALAYLDPRAWAVVEALPAAAPQVDERSPESRRKVETLPDGTLLARSPSGPRGVGTAVVRLRLADAGARPGEVAALRARLAAALELGHGTAGWVIDAPLPGADRDGLAFGITAAEPEMPAALAHLCRTLATARLDQVPPAASEVPWGSVRDRALDDALTALLEDSPHGVRRYAPAPDAEVPADPTMRLEELRALLLRPENRVLALVGPVAPEALEAALGEFAAPPPPREPATSSPPPATPAARRADEGAMVLAARLPEVDPTTLQAAATLAEVLGGGPASRLGRRLRSVRGLGFEVGARLLVHEKGPAVLVAWIGCARDSMELAELVLREEVTRLTLHPVSTDEVVAAREALLAGRLTRIQSTRAMALALAAEAQQGIDTMAWTEVVDALTLQELARDTFHEARIESFTPHLALGVGPTGPGAVREN